jgi:hypothetical protein
MVSFLGRPSHTSKHCTSRFLLLPTMSDSSSTPSPPLSPMFPSSSSDLSSSHILTGNHSVQTLSPTFPVDQVTEYPYHTGNGHTILLSHPVTFSFPPNCPLDQLAITVMQMDHEPPRAIITFQPFDQDDTWKHIAAKEIMIHGIIPPFSSPLDHLMMTATPVQSPSIPNTTLPPYNPLRVKLRPIVHLDAYELLELPYCDQWEVDTQLSVGAHLIWNVVEMQVVGIRRIYENIVVFIAQETTSLFTIEIWTPKVWADTPPMPQHWMFKDRSNRTITMPSPVPERFVASLGR